MADSSEDRIRVLIVDDERLSRERLRVLLEGEPDVQVVGECENGLRALDAISARHPELVFLDVQMPDLDGLGVLEALDRASGGEWREEIIFVTAYNTYMERAFEVHAVDYLRKPYTNARFESALEHGRRRVLARRNERPETGPANHAALVAAMRLERAGPVDARIVVQDRRTATWHILTTDQIDWIDTDGSAHVRLHRGEQSYQLRKTLAELEHELSEHGFLRVHRSHIVNASRIRAVKALQKGEYAIVLEGGTIIDTGRTYREVVARFLQHT
jgi:two-component system LytT family response regulator